MVESTSGRIALDEAGGPPTIVILPQRGWFDWRLKQLWLYRDLIDLFVWRDFVSVYKQTILGPAWHIVRPLLTTLIFMLVFSRVARLSTDGVPPFLFYFSGIITWTYFATCLDNITKTFVANLNLLGKVYFPRLSIPLSLVFSNLVSFGIQFAIFMIALLAYIVTGQHVHLTVWALTAPLLLVMLAGYALGIGVMLCAMTTRYRDLTYLVTFGTQLMMFLTPVIYPVSAVPERYRWVAELNPLTSILEAFRLGFLGVGTVRPANLAASFVGMLVVLIFGVAFFTRAEQTVIDTI